MLGIGKKEKQNVSKNTENIKIGTVGVPAHGVELKLAEDGEILGIVSEESILQKGAHRNGLVGRVMHPGPTIVDIGLSVIEARRRLTEVEVLLVVEGDILAGLVTRMDLVHALRLNSIG